MTLLRQMTLDLRQRSGQVHSMSDWQGFLYPAVAGNDLAHELYLTSLGRISCSPGAAYPLVGHPPEYQFNWNAGRVLGDFAMVWIERGSGRVETASMGQVPMSPGFVLLLPPGAWHRYQPDTKTGWVERWICANGTYLHRLQMKNVFPSNAELRPIENCNALHAAFDQLRAHAEWNNLRTSGLALTAIALALGETGKSRHGGSVYATTGDPLVDATIHYIWTNCHRSLDVDAIAVHSGVSRRMLERRFARSGSRSISRELTMARVSRGRDLLSEHSLTVKEAGYAAGFAGARLFIAAHRRIFGTTPGFARRQGAAP